MKFLMIVAVGLAFLLVLGFRHRRSVVRRRKEPYYESIRVFKPDVDPFNPDERIEFFVRKRRDPD